MKKRNVWIAALSAFLVLALAVGLWSGGVFAPKGAALSAPAERQTLPADPSAPEAADSETADALPLAATAAEQKPWTPPIQNLVTESIGAPSEEIPAEQLITEPVDVTNPEILEDETVSYDGEHFLVKLAPEADGTVTPALASAGVTALEPMMRLDNGAWFLAYVGENGDVKAAVEAARSAEGVLVAEYDFASQTMASIIDSDTVADCVTDNPKVRDSWQLRTGGLQQAWSYQEHSHLAVAGAGTTVAVIDTGVDVDHKDLAANMWRNVNEVPDNNIDDDGNGYVDDYYGVNVVTGKGSGDDDHGHGTHVAGIIASVNNKEGTVGVAYNAKIMAVKAGQASGYFLQSDIAKAIVYAYENGADVINMSFGGTSASMAVQDALATAYTRCVLVASAGNEGKPNEKTGGIVPTPNYPAAFPYVLGVMSLGEKGVESSFSNWDVKAYSGAEYEVYAPGEGIMSTIPGDRYAAWSGTSMASPYVAAFAAMLRADFPDSSTYPTKFIYGQIAGTGTTIPTCCDPDHHGTHNLPPMCNALNALKELPHPELGVSDYLIYDTESISARNDGDGGVDSGETVALGFTLRNRWGMSKDTMVTVDALSSAGVANPYVTFSTTPDGAGSTSATVNYGSVGTYSEKNCGVVYNDAGAAVGWESPFYLHIDPDCPNDTTLKLNVSVTAGNGLDDSDNNAYTFTDTINITARRGVFLPEVITEDTTLTADNYYILSHNMLVNTGATLTVEPGTQIQFWSPSAQNSSVPEGDAKIVVAGALRLIGTEDAHIRLFPSESFPDYTVNIERSGSGASITMEFCEISNPYHFELITMRSCTVEAALGYAGEYHYTTLSNSTVSPTVKSTTAVDSLFSGVGVVSGDYQGCAFVNCSHNPFSSALSSYADCVFFRDPAQGARMKDSGQIRINDDILVSSGPTVTGTYYDETTGTAYVAVQYAPRKSIQTWNYYFYDAEIARLLGGSMLQVETAAEKAFLQGTGCVFRALMERGSESPYWIADVLGDPLHYTLVPGADLGDVYSYSVLGRAAVTGYTVIGSRSSLWLFETDPMSDYPMMVEIPNADTALSVEEAQAILDGGFDKSFSPAFRNNAILNPVETLDESWWLRALAEGSGSYHVYGLGGIYWGTTDPNLIKKQIWDFSNSATLFDYDPSGFLTEAPENVWPFVSDVEIYNQEGERITTVGNEPLTFRVCFNRDMDTSIDLSVRFGSTEPYADYEIEGAWIDARTWEGSTTLTTLIENGTQVLRITNGKAADEAKELMDDFGRFTFTIDTSAAQAMVMQAAADDNGILLTWYQDDFDTLAGYNVYRSTSEDGFYQRLNSSVIPADVKEFYDDTVEPGQVYYYNFTVVKSDLTESTPSGKVTIMSKDTMAPVMYHTPVYQAFTGSNLIINATVTDNVAVQSVKLYYRQTGAPEWTVIEMNKLNDKYSAVISSALVTTQGLEYYIEAFDGVSHVYRGTADAPYAVIVQEAVDLTDKGDVNGDGRITNLDALMLLQAVNDRLNLDAAQFARADINDNGELEAVEALRILHYVSGKVTSILF